MLKLATFGVLCVAALVVATFAREERRATTFAALVVSLNWMLFVSPWVCNGASPAHLLNTTGLSVSHADMWAAADLISLLAIVAACGHLWWSAFFIATYLAMLTMHVVAYVMGLEYIDYSHVLDASLIVQIAVLLLLGGDGCGDWLLGRWRFYRFHMVGWTPLGCDKKEAR